MAFNGRNFVIMTDDETGDGVSALWSRDGHTWTRAAFTASGEQFNQVRVLNGQFVAVGGLMPRVCAGCTYPAYLATSPDGISWQGHPSIGSITSATQGLTDVTFANGLYFVTGQSLATATSAQNLFSSPDLNTWTPVSGAPQAANMYSLCSHPGAEVIAVGAGGDIVATHDDDTSSSGGGGTGLLTLAILLELAVAQRGWREMR